MRKYEQVKNQIGIELKTLGRGKSLSPMRELMRRYDVSLSTLNRAIGELERENLLVRKQGAGIYCNHEEVNRSNTVGVVVPSLQFEFDSQLVRGMSEALAEAGLGMLLSQTCIGGGLNIPLESNSARDILINPSSTDISRMDYINSVQQFQKQGGNIVAIDIPIPGVASDFVGLDNYSAFRKIGAELLHGNNKRFVFAGRTNSFVYAKRLGGFQDALFNSGADCISIDCTLADTAQVAQEIASKKPHTVLLADGNTASALALELGRIFRETSVQVGIVGVAEQNQRIPGLVCTLEKPSIDMGRKAVEMLLRRRSEHPAMRMVDFLPLAIHWG